MAQWNYNPQKDGAITAIRIYYENDRTPMADLTFTYGGMAKICWVNPEHRNSYSSGINGYTLYFDEREKADFQSFIK